MRTKRILSIICVFAMVFTAFGTMPAASETTENVLITEDFEGGSPAFIGNQGTLLPVDETTDSGTNTGSGSGSGCDGTAATAEDADTEAVNHYMDLYLTTAADYSGYDYGSSAQVYVDSMPESFMLTADIYQESDNTNDFIFEYFSDDFDGDGNSDTYGGLSLSARDVGMGEWYTLTVKKVQGTGNSAVFKTTLVNKNTGEETTPVVTRRGNVSSVIASNRFMFRCTNVAEETTHWLIDNVTVEENFDFELPSNIVTVDTYYDGEKVEVDGITWTILEGVKGTVDDKTTTDKSDDEYIDAVVTPTGYVNDAGNIVATTRDKINLKTNVPYGVNLYSKDNNTEGNPMNPANFTANHDLEMRIRYDACMHIMYYTGTHRFFLYFASDSMLVCNDKDNNQLPVEADFGGFGQWLDLKLSVRDTKWGTIGINGEELMTFEMPEAPGRAPYVQYALYKTDLVTNLEIDSVRLTPIDSDSLYINSVSHYDTVSEGADVTLTTNTGSGEIYVNGVNVGTDTGSGVVLSNIQKGVYDIYTKSGDATSEPIRIFAEAESGESESSAILSNSDREYTVEYEYDGSSQNSLMVNDGYFTLDLSHSVNQISYRSYDKNDAVYTGVGNGIGAGKYKIVVTSGYAEVYYNGQFVFSDFLPYTYNEASNVSFTHSGLNNVTKTQSGVKLQRYHTDWSGDAEFADYNVDLGRFYSVEFDKLDASYETIYIYDGEYQAKLTFDERGISAETQREDFDVTEEYLMGDTIPTGYYRLTVAKGLAQLFCNNQYVDSFRCPAVNHKQSIFRNMDNPEASTFIAVKNTDDIYFHSEDFEGGREYDPLDYWFSEQEGLVLAEGASDPFTQELVTEDGNTYLKITDSGLEPTTEYDAEPVGDFTLNVSADNPDMSWRAKADGNGEVHFIARQGQKGVFLSFSYSFTDSEWRLSQYNRTKTSSGTKYDGKEVLVSNSGSLDTDWHDYKLVMNDGDVALLCDGETVLSYSGLLNAHGRAGFGVSGGATLSVDDIVYSGEGKVSGGFSYISWADSDSKDFFYHPLYEGIVAANTRQSSFISRDRGKTWELLEKGYYVQMLNTLGGNFLGVSYGSSGWNIHRTFAALYPSQAYENWGSGNHMVNGRWGSSDLLIEPEEYDTADYGRVLLPSRFTQVQDGKYKGRIFMTRNICNTEEYGGTALFYTDFDNEYDPADTSYYDGTTTKTSTSNLYNIEWTETEKPFTYENYGINGQESQVVDMPNDVIRYFVRTDSGFLEYADSYDGGATFGEFKQSQLISPMDTFGIMRDPANLDHYYAFFQYDANTSDKHPNGGRPRSRTALAVSYDAMENWHYVMDVDELTDDWSKHYDPCNHGMRVIDGVVYMSYGVGTGYSKIFAADISKMKPLKRFSEVHDRIDRYTNNAQSIKAENVIIPKSSGTGMIYGETVEFAVTNGNYSADILERIFGITETETGAFDFFGTSLSIPVDENGNYNIADAAELFSKNLIETECAYIISLKIWELKGHLSRRRKVTSLIC